MLWSSWNDPSSSASLDVSFTSSTIELERSVIERQSRRLVHLVDDLLDVSRIARGKVLLRRERLDVAEVVAEAVEQVAPLIRERGHELIVEVAPGLSIDGDRVRLAQAVSNLLSNAAKYTDPGGHIRVVGEIEAGRVRLAFTDDGIGLAPELVPRLFDMFVQAPQAIDRAQGGLGLGLTIVQKLVELHGGSVTAHSAGPSQGSTFTIRLPAAPAAERQPLVESPFRVLRSEPIRRRVLVVDDNRDSAELVAECLAFEGHEVRAAFDGREALAAAESLDPEVVVLDIGLPLMDGYEVARRLREPGRPLRLIALTGYGQDADRTRALAAGFDAHLVKPVELSKLLAAVSEEPGAPPRSATT